MIAKGKHELKTHIPIRTHEYLKKRAERGHGIGQLIAEAVDAYASLDRLSKQMEVQGNHLERILQLLETNQGPHMRGADHEE